jgi:hypothetical protein
VTVLGPGIAPAPLPITAASLGESTEASLVAFDGLLDQAVQRSTSGDLRTSVLDSAAGGRITVMADGSSRIVPADLPRGSRVHLVGVAGQRATRRGRLDGYRIWLRDRADIVVTAPAPGPSTGPSGSGGGLTVLPIARALLQGGQDVRVVGTVTAGGASLGDPPRLVTIQDSSAAVEVRLPVDVRAPRVGHRLDIVGRIGRPYGAPRLNAAVAKDLGPGSAISPLLLHGSPGPAHEWRLVRLDGDVVGQHRTGDRWSAEVIVGRDRVVVVGTAGAGVPASAIVEGHRVTVVGIVRRPYPTASDRRFTVDPRTSSDVRSGGLSAGVGASGAGTNGTLAVGSGSPVGTAGPLDLDLAELAEHLGAVVRVGGSIQTIDDTGFTLGDGTGLGRIVLLDEAASYLSLLAPGDVLNAVGVVVGTAAGPEVRVSDPAGITRVDNVGIAAGQDPGAASPDVVEPTRPVTRAEGLGGLGSNGPVGLGILVALSVASAGVTIARWRRGRRALKLRIASRLAAIGAPRAVRGGPDGAGG